MTRGCMSDIRHRYGVPAYRGARVEFRGKPGRITGTSRSAMHLRIRLDDSDGRSFAVHPTWEMTYLVAVTQPTQDDPK